MIITLNFGVTASVCISQVHLFKQVVSTLTMMMIPTFLVSNLKILRVNLKLNVIRHRKE